MTEGLHTLIVDDNPDDRALAIRELRRTFTNLQIEEIIDAAGFERSLGSGCPNLVITDYQLRWTDGLAVLRTIKSRWPDCPVVMFTGTGSEEIAVEAMKAGLDDYVLKSPKHYARLPAAIQLALKLATQRCDLKEAENRYSKLFTTVPVGLYRMTPQGKIVDVNPALIEMLGYPDQASLLNVNASELFVSREDYERWRSQMEREGIVHNYEIQLRTYDGRTCWVQDTAKVIRDPRTRQTCYEGTMEDISERKAVEEEREQLILDLQDALAKVQTLGGLLPICAACKKVRDDKGYWSQIEVFIQSHSDAEFTHSCCPDCMKRLYPEVFDDGIKVR